MQRTQETRATHPSRTVLERQIDAAQERLAQFKRRLRQPDADVQALANTALEELASSLEELHVTQEELRQQETELQKVREQLAVEGKRYHDLYTFAPDGYLVTDSNGVIQDANRAALSLLETSLKAVSGKPLVLFVDADDRSTLSQKINRLRAGGSAKREPWEIRILPTDNRPFHASVTTAPGYDDNGSLTHIRWLIRDITTRKRMERRLSFQSQLLDNIQESVVATNLEGRIIYWNRGAERLYGYLADEAMGKPVTFLVEPGPDREQEEERMRQVRETGAWHGQYRQRRRDGSIFWAETRIALMTDEKGEPFGYIGVDRDITDRIQMEERLRFQAQLLEAVEQSVIAISPTGRIIYWNNESEKLFGWSADQAVGRNVVKLLTAGGTRAKASEIMQRLTDGKSWSGEFPLKCRDGHVFPAIVTASPIQDPKGRVVGAIGVITDITERVEAEKKLERYSRRLSDILGSIRDGFFALDEDLRITYYNQAAELILERDREELLGRKLFDAFPEARESVFEERFRQAIRAKEPVSFETHVDVEPYADWYAVNIYPQEQGISVYFQIITERKEAEIALRQSRDFLSATGRIADVGGWEIDVADKDIRWTSQTYRIYGVPVEYEPTLEKILDFYLPEDREKLDGAIERAIDTGVPFDIELRLVTGEGVERWVRLLSEPRIAGGETVELVGAIQDVTEQKAMAEQLRHQEQLAALGEMAGGIAHDFNNLLASIMLYAQLPLNRHTELPDDVTRSLKTILTESDRAAQLVQQILDFSRRAILQTEHLNLVTFTQDVINILKRTIPENIRIQLNLACRQCVIEADPTRIQQVLINLALNARDAMPGGGKLRIDLDHRTLSPDESPPVNGMEPGAWAHLQVSDTGTGMPEEVLSHLFEPFFTTKEPGQGTGLGLSQVYGIIKQHEGFIDVESAPGEGTTFSIYLPSQAESAVAPEDAGAVEMMAGNGERVLLVEDAEALRTAIESFLASVNYRVSAAANGREALDLAEAARPDLLITDVVMPEMGGQELLHRIRQMYPDLKAVAITGHLLHSEITSLLDAGFDEQMSKPFDTRELSGVIQTLLNEENPA